MVPVISPVVAAMLRIKPHGLLTQQEAQVGKLKAETIEFVTMRRLAMRFRGILRGHDGTRPDP